MICQKARHLTDLAWAGRTLFQNKATVLATHCDFLLTFYCFLNCKVKYACYKQWGDENTLELDTGNGYKTCEFTKAYWPY